MVREKGGRGEVRFLSDEFNFKTSTVSFGYLRDVVEYYKKNIKNASSVQLQQAYQHTAQMRGVSYDAISMGVYRAIDTSIPYSKINDNYPTIQRSLGIKEIIVRFAKICLEEGCEF